MVVLNRSNMGLFDIVTTEIRALSALTYLALQGNNLSGELPPELGNLTSLTHMYLSNNSFSGAFPSSLTKLTNLLELELGDNHRSFSDVYLRKRRRLKCLPSHAQDQRPPSHV